jgi:NAD(P)-dependent dehydrogenase (short-subunit alcohol dehydrogenase family)
VSATDLPDTRETPTTGPEAVRLDDRIVVVTGAANGIGRATALLCARFGADVAVCDRDADGLERLRDEVAATGRRCVADVLDVRDADAVGGFVATVAERLGHVHGLVNNAGGTFRSSFLDGGSKGDHALVSENFTSVLDVTRAVLAVMAPDGGAIVNVTSSEAFQAAPGFAVYAAMKAGLESLTKTLALELASSGVRVNSVSPDGVATSGDEMLVDDVRATSEFLPPSLPPVGRMADPSECASVIVFLLGDLARFVTGTTVHVDGGLHAAGGWRRREDA